eukprot:4334955-Pyramimonas_sp.AAC.1
MPLVSQRVLRGGAPEPVGDRTEHASTVRNDRVMKRFVRGTETRRRRSIILLPGRWPAGAGGRSDWPAGARPPPPPRPPPPDRTADRAPGRQSGPRPLPDQRSAFVAAP